MSGNNLVALRIGERSLDAVYMNLKRRADRRKSLLQRLQEVGLADGARRVDAVDGRCLDLASLDPLTIACGIGPTSKGYTMTRGAVGLYLSWQRMLEELQQSGSNEKVHLILEDDASFASSFCRSAQELIVDLDSFDPAWDLVTIGYDARATQLGEACNDRGTITRFQHPLIGAYGLLLNGARAATNVLAALFPVTEFDGPLDIKLAHMSFKPRTNAQKTLRQYISTRPLISATHSSSGDTDIQNSAHGMSWLPPALENTCMVSAQRLRELGGCLSAE